MKKFVCVLMTLILALGLSACNGDVVAIEDYEWKMGAVMRNDIEAAQNEDELVVAVGEEDDIHPNAKIVDLKLVAKDGSITITDATNNKTYSGTYKVQQKTPKGTDYEVTIDGIKGYATVAPTEYYDGSEVPTLPINLGEYTATKLRSSTTPNESKRRTDGYLKASTPTRVSPERATKSATSSTA